MSKLNRREPTRNERRFDASFIGDRRADDIVAIGSRRVCEHLVPDELGVRSDNIIGRDELRGDNIIRDELGVIVRDHFVYRRRAMLGLLATGVGHGDNIIGCARDGLGVIVRDNIIDCVRDHFVCDRWATLGLLATGNVRYRLINVRRRLIFSLVRNRRIRAHGLDDYFRLNGVTMLGLFATHSVLLVPQPSDT
jgi:hypothetical protein